MGEGSESTHGQADRRPRDRAADRAAGAAAGARAPLRTQGGAGPLKRRSDLLEPLAAALAEAAAKIVACENCGNIDTLSPCTICRDPRRDATLIVVVEEIGDLWALERAGVVDGLYHVLGGHLSPLDGIGPASSTSAG